MGNVGEFYPENLHRIFVLNTGWLVNMMFAFGRTFMTKRMLDKYVVASYADLKKYIDDDQLLKVLGGDADMDFDYDREVELDEKRHAK
ncbi:SFH5 [Acrasis kona]|uniref:SFH5 n=1 Tax=Acrasis kona TaxID=1008807 RepID=A0AAW2YIA6_9EUKA